MSAPSVQGRLEIPIKVSVKWNESEKLSVLVAKVKGVEYLLTGRVCWWLEKYFQVLGIEKDEDDDEDVEFQT